MPKKKPKAADLLPENIQPTVQLWMEACVALERVKERELELRWQLRKVFPEQLKEGVNKVAYQFDGKTYELVLTHRINRTVNAATLDAVMAQLPETSLGRKLGEVIEFEPKLVKKGFDLLPEYEQKVVQQTLIEKEGTPAIELREAKGEVAATGYQITGQGAVTISTSMLSPIKPSKENVNVAGYELVQVGNRLYVPHPLRAQVGPWAAGVVVGQNGTTSFEVFNLGSCVEVLWNGVPVDPWTGQPCQEVNRAEIERYAAEQKRQNEEIAARNGLPPKPEEKPPTSEPKKGKKGGKKK